MNKLLYLSLLLVLNLFLTSCTHMIYHPTRTLYVNPEKLKIQPEPIKIKSEKLGIDIHGWHFKPTQQAENKCLLYLHGNAQNRSSHFLSLYWLPTQGYHYYIFDYPGYGQTQGDPTPQSTVASAKETIKYLVNSHCKKLYIYGHSLGGQIAMRAVWELDEKTQKDIALLIVDSSFLSYQNVAKTLLQKYWYTWPLSWIPYVTISDANAIGDQVSEIQTPMLVIHSKNDEIIDVQFGQEIYDKSTNPKKLWLKTTQHNNLYDLEEGLRLRGKLIKEFKSY